MPALFTCCTNHTCYDCAEKYRNDKITQLKRNEKKIPCMWCGRKFHSSKDTPWVVNNHLIEVMGIDVDLTHVREIQASFRGVATNNRPRHQSNAAALSNNNHEDGGMQIMPTLPHVQLTKEIWKGEIKRLKSLISIAA